MTLLCQPLLRILLSKPLALIAVPVGTWSPGGTGYKAPRPARGSEVSEVPLSWCSRGTSRRPLPPEMTRFTLGQPLLPCWGLRPPWLPQRVCCIKVATVSSIFLSQPFLFFAFDPIYARGPGSCLPACDKWEHLGKRRQPGLLVPGPSPAGSWRGPAAQTCKWSRV